MAPHQERALVEKQDLDNKIVALEGFVAESPFYRSLPREEKDRLLTQLGIMQNYSAILGERIEAF